MNTERSDELIRAWERGPNPLRRTNLSLERTFRTSAEELFPLLCPTREYDWISGWRCELLHSESGHAEYNAIFRTNLLGYEEIWVCTRYEPNRAIDYTRLAEGLCTKLEISLTDHSDGTVGVRWVMTASALVDDKNQAVARMEEGPERLMILEHLFDDLEHYVATGERRS